MAQDWDDDRRVETSAARCKGAFECNIPQSAQAMRHYKLTDQLNGYRREAVSVPSTFYGIREDANAGFVLIQA